jgi:hypothetical protein
MKTLILTLMLTFCSSEVNAEEIFRIQIGSNSISGTSPTSGGNLLSYRERELLRRIHQLELAVDQLQRKVFDMENDRSYRPIWTTCYIQTPFDGTFRATEPTQTAARAKVLDRCAKTVGHSSATFCQEREVKCGK